MKTAFARTGRRMLVALEPGDEVVASLAEACRTAGIEQAVITTFSGAFRWARIIASDHAPVDPELPLPEEARIGYSEGVGSGTILRGEDGAHIVHVHVAFGEKDRSGAAAAGHLLEAETHYVVEIVVDEVLDPPLRRAPHPGASGLHILDFPEQRRPLPAEPA